jgi:hypothetical protein
MSCCNVAARGRASALPEGRNGRRIGGGRTEQETSKTPLLNSHRRHAVYAPHPLTSQPSLNNMNQDNSNTKKWNGIRLIQENSRVWKRCVSGQIGFPEKKKQRWANISSKCRRGPQSSTCLCVAHDLAEVLVEGAGENVFHSGTNEVCFTARPKKRKTGLPPSRAKPFSVPLSLHAVIHGALESA